MYLVLQKRNDFNNNDTQLSAEIPRTEGCPLKQNSI